ncbi:phosphoketolase [Tsukamurella tyrosinosolvens]|jgi:xylulose-5-phosphate/fructose-6-phosphate phosphoketolase|uniref:phosphoketolase family protein n=1 Tax=Tsukamurella tyrosinosolvens TaxID=57704 RepID=UPI000C7EA143|nr:phosphoketolase family protein [Tsukamurella tyrosinosolvens]AUN38675.1 phosphoketolase [Tsukamurella tyrosinosolvens]HVG84528.1 phosphoketolase family protein [Vicinamibacterales bacterium]
MKYASQFSTATADVTVRQVDAQWRAANYLTVGQLYLRENPLLTDALTLDHIKPRPLGHWGTAPGLNFIYSHVNRAIIAHDLDALCVVGPGHGGAALCANSWLDGTYSAAHPEVPQNCAGMRELFRQFSTPEGVPSHTGPHIPGSIHEGGELGYSLAHAYGAVMDNPGLVAVCIVGDGEAETGPLAASWHANKFVNPDTDGTVLPILHLNGYKLDNPTVLSRIPTDQLDSLLRGYGYVPLFVFAGGCEVFVAHERMTLALDRAVDLIREGRQPVIVFESPKGWTGPRIVEGLPVEGTWRSHQLPYKMISDDGHLEKLQTWLLSYQPGALFDADGKPAAHVQALIPRGDARMSANRHTNGGAILQRLDLAEPAQYAVDVPQAAPGTADAAPTTVLGHYLADVFDRNAQARNFRLFGPDETTSNRLTAVYRATGKRWNSRLELTDANLDRDGRVMEILSEHLCQGWLEGYLLTGRHGMLSCYEAFAHLVDSMVDQHAKWLKTAAQAPGRLPIASLNQLITSHVWRQDHNGFSHQDPGYLDHITNIGADVAAIYLPPDTNTLLHVARECLSSTGKINVIVAGKHDSPVWFDATSAAEHCERGAGIIDWTSTPSTVDRDDESFPDIVLGCAGDVPTTETIAAAHLLQHYLPQLRTRVVNVVDLLRLQSPSQYRYAISDAQYEGLFPPTCPTLFAFHGYPALIHRLTYRRPGHEHLHVRGFTDRGSTTTPFDMLVRNGIDRYQLVIDAIDLLPDHAAQAAALRQKMVDAHTRHKQWIRDHGTDMPSVQHWYSDPEEALDDHGIPGR